MLHVFIDTNIYLSFYYYTSEDLKELKKLQSAIKKKEISLYIPEQVVIEYKRQREKKIFDALKLFREEFKGIPAICRAYPEYNQLINAKDEYIKKKDGILANINKDIRNNSLAADKIILDIINSVKIIKNSDKYISLAKRRKELGNPPGKGTSLGDGINWEILLGEVSANKTLYFISDDSDYFSPLNDNTISQFLFEEWKNKKGSDVILYKKLSSFFAEQYSKIKLAGEKAKEAAISALVNSSNFLNTHAAITGLSKYTEFTPSQINELIKACITNNQINWIINDWDVSAFFDELVRGKEEIVDPKNMKEYQRIREEAKASEPEDVYCQYCRPEQGLVDTGDVCPSCGRLVP